MSPEMTSRLSRALGRSRESWLAMQRSCDLWVARKSSDLSRLQRAEFEAA